MGIEVATLDLTANTGSLKSVEPMLKGVEKQAAKTEAATKRLGKSSETELTKGAKGAQALDSATKRLDASTKSAASAQNQMAAATARATAAATAQAGVMRSSTGQIGNIAAQFNDIGMMMAAGQNPIQLALQQGTQLGQVFTQMGSGTQVLRGLGSAFLSVISPVNLLTVGIIAGGAALVNWVMSGESAVDITERLGEMTDELAASTSQYVESSKLARTSVEELAKTYGYLADEVQRAMANQANADLANLTNSAQQQAQALLSIMTEMRTFSTGEEGPFGPVTEEVRVLIDSFGIAGTAASGLIDALEGVAAARGPQETADAALQLQAALDAARNSAGQLPPELESIYSWATQVAQTSGEISKIMSDWPGILAQGASAAGVMAGQVNGITNAAIGGAKALWDMVGAMGAAYRTAAAGASRSARSIPGMANPDPNAPIDVAGEAAAVQNRLTQMRIDKVGNWEVPKGGGSGGGGSSAASEAEKEAEAIAKVTEALENQITMIGMTEEQKRVFQETQKAGVELNSAEGQAIEALVQKLAQLEEAHKRAAEIGKALAQGIEDIFVAALQGADSAREAASKLLMELGRLLIHQAFQQMFKGLGGGGGFLGALFGGARAGGGPVQAGVPYLVNENTPRSEVFVPSKSGAVLNVPQAQKALAGASGGSRTEVNVMAVNDYASAAREFRRQFRNDPGVEADIARILERLGRR